MAEAVRRAAIIAEAFGLARLGVPGTGRSTENDGELAKGCDGVRRGATGFGTRLLLRLLTQP